MVYDIRRMYHQARGFQLAAERCLEIREHSEQNSLPIQAIANYSFACEVYFKAIYAFEHPDQHELGKHYLDILYGQVSDFYKDKIASKLSSQYSREDILRYLCEFRNVFIEYRYIYEMDSDDRTNFSFLQTLSIILQDVVGELTQKYVLRLAGLKGML